MLAPIGVYPNTAFGLPVPNQAKNATVSLKASKKVKTGVQATKRVMIKSKP